MKKLVSPLCAVCALASTALPMQAATRTFGVASGDWTTPSNWLTAAPITGDTAVIGAGTVATGTAAINPGDSISMARVTVGVGAGTNGVLNMTGGTLAATATSNGSILIGDAGGTGHLNLSGATSFINASNAVYLGRGNGSVGSVSVSSGTLQATTIYAGGANVGTTTGVSSGTLTVSGGAVVSSGLLRVAHAAVGDGNSVTGVVNHSGGLVSASGVEVQSSGAGNGVYNFSGGELQIGTGGGPNANLRGGGTGTRAFNWSGGTLSVGNIDQLTVASSIGTINLQSGGSGAILNSTNSNAVASQIVIQSGISGDGGLTIRGSGTVNYQISSATYTGDTNIESGTLLLSNVVGSTFSSAKIAVQDGAVLAGVGTITVNDLVGGGTVSGNTVVRGDVSGGDFGTIDTLTFTQGLTLDDEGAFTFDFLNIAQADLVIASSLTVLGVDPVVISVNSLVGAVVQAGDIFTVFQGSTDGLSAGNFQVNNLSSWAGGFDVLVGANSVQLQAVPEPSTYALLAGGIALLALRSRRKRR